ncbi:MAG: cytochrome c [Pyrinomonadaceae bacterium]
MKLIVRMRTAKIIVISVFISLTAVSCLNSRPSRYVITNNKTYEASLFRQNCMICHGPEGEGKTLDDGRIIPNIRDGEHKYNTDQQIYDHIANGGNGMVPFRGILTDREIDMLVILVQRDLRQNRLR